jgi:hypothetical protein
MTAKLPEFHLPRQLFRLCALLVTIGSVTAIVGLLLAPQYTWANVLVVSYGLLGMGLAGAVFVALLYVTAAGWAVALRRVPEALVAVLPTGLLGIVLVLLAQPTLYAWTKAEEPAEGEPLSPFHQTWLVWPFFLVRALIYAVAWVVLTFAIVRISRRQDGDGDLAWTRWNVRLSAIFLVVFSVTFWLASLDWIMSLEPAWSSTMFGMYNFAGLFLGGLAAIVLLVVWLRQSGPLRHIIAESHLHDLGKLLFAFSTFWAYIWFCQYMLIWYVNNPEETTYYVRRLQGAWGPLVIVNAVVNWVVPFCVLLPSAAKRNPKVLVRVAALVLLGRWLDLYLMIVPACGETAPLFGVETGLALGGAGLLFLVVCRDLRRAPLIPINDPFLVESLPHRDSATFSVE